MASYKLLSISLYGNIKKKQRQLGRSVVINSQCMA